MARYAGGPVSNACRLPTPNDPLSSTDDLSLIGRIQLNDVAAYESLFRAYYASLCAFATGFTESWDVGEDLVQGVFTTLWERRDRLQVTGSVRGYLYAAVRHEALNWRKHRRIVERTQDDFAAIDRSPAHPVSPLPQDAVLEHGEQAAQIRAAIAQLPERAREVLTLRWEHDMTYDEIAVILGVLPASAKMQHSRALAALRKRLAELL